MVIDKRGIQRSYIRYFGAGVRSTKLSWRGNKLFEELYETTFGIYVTWSHLCDIAGAQVDMVDFIMA